MKLFEGGIMLMKPTVMTTFSSFMLILLIALCPDPGTTMAGEIDDETISDTVVDELVHDPVVEAHWIDVVSQDGIATLSGRVENILAKERSALIAGTVMGVRGVVNLLEVIPPAHATDEDVKDAVEDALRSDPATDLFEVGVSVSGGTVTLIGQVDSWQQKKLCSVVAESVQGVTGVRNEIAYNTNSIRLDNEIRVETEQAIYWDALVDGRKVDVRVINGEAVLNGMVASLAEKRRVVDHAYLSGAETVDDEGLEVAWWYLKKRDDVEPSAEELKPTDKDIRTAVSDVLLRDPRVSPFRIIVEVDNGAVTLRGTVDNLRARSAATRSAENTVGVVRVTNRLKVRPAAVYLDADIKSSIERSFRRDPFVPVEEIRIGVHSGVVELSGSVNTGFERSRAEELAMRVNGVVGVNNHILISRALMPIPYNPYVDDWYAQDSPYPHDPSRVKTTKSDLEITLDVEKELYWSPFADSDRIEVDVEDGIVTLTGTFDSRSEFYAATKNAFDGGAIAVKNELLYSGAEPK